jgi:hypothetical protein
LPLHYLQGVFFLPDQAGERTLIFFEQSSLMSLNFFLFLYTL